MSSPLAERYQRILAEIRRLSPEATLLAVSKGQSVDAIEELYRLGHRDFGENYAQEFLAKARELEDVRGCAGIRWHFIGHLQTNKVKQLLPRIAVVHTVDSDRLARELAKRWRESGREGKLPIFIEVNIDQETSKAGLAPDAVPAFARALVAEQGAELDLLGLMCIPAADRPEAATRSSFRHLRELEAACHPASRGFLSMGMSSDYPLALQEGATHVRVGTALFGKRD